MFDLRWEGSRLGGPVVDPSSRSRSSASRRSKAAMSRRSRTKLERTEEMRREYEERYASDVLQRLSRTPPGPPPVSGE